MDSKCSSQGCSDTINLQTCSSRLTGPVPARGCATGSRPGPPAEKNPGPASLFTALGLGFESCCRRRRRAALRRDEGTTGSEGLAGITGPRGAGPAPGAGAGACSAWMAGGMARGREGGGMASTVDAPSGGERSMYRNHAKGRVSQVLRTKRSDHPMEPQESSSERSRRHGLAWDAQGCRGPCPLRAGRRGRMGAHSPGVREDRERAPCAEGPARGVGRQAREERVPAAALAHAAAGLGRAPGGGGGSELDAEGEGQGGGAQAAQGRVLRGAGAGRALRRRRREPQTRRDSRV